MARTIGSFADVTGPRIREAALRLIAEHGFAAVSMRRIAGEAGLQVGAIYQYIPDKQSLLFQIMNDHMDTLLDAWRQMPRGGTPVERLNRFTGFHLGFHLDRPDEVFIAYMELRNLSAQNFAVIETKRRAYEEALDAILADGVAAGVFRIEEPRLSTMAIIAMLTGVTTWYREGGRLDRPSVEASYKAMVLRMVGAA